MTNNNPAPDNAPSREEVVAGLKGSLRRMLQALSAAQQTAPTPEDADEVAKMIQMAEQLAKNTMSALGEPSSDPQETRDARRDASS